MTTQQILAILSASFSLLGGLSFGRGLFISNQQALTLGVSRVSGTDEENMKLPAVKDRIEQRKWGILGAILSVFGFVFQIALIFVV